MTPTFKKPRPYWHVDAKWISGICLLLLLSFTSLVFIVWQVTDRPTGTTLLTTLLASTFSYQNGGLDADSDIKIMRAMIANAPNKEWQPSPGMEIIVHEADIAGKTPREVRMWFFRQLAEPLYDEGAQGLASLITDPALKKGVEENAKPLSFISAETHSKLRGILVASGVASLVLLGLLVIFSYRFGRIGSPGWVIFLVAAPGLLLWGALRGGLTQLAQNPPAAAQQEAVKYYTQLAVDVLPVIVEKAVQVYTFLILFALGLIVIALIGSVFVRERKSREDGQP
jgi:hypothetical protein